MRQVWRFTDLEFKVLWERYNKTTRMPEPLVFTSRTKYFDDYEREKQEIWDRLRDTVDGPIRDVVEVLARPEVLIKTQGWYDADIQDPAKWIRARAVRSGAQGYLLTQTPGETPMHSGGYTITDCGPHGVAEAIVTTLPKVEAGRIVSLALPPEWVGGLATELWGRPSVTEHAATYDAGPVERFFGTPAERTGLLTVHQGHSKFGPRGILEHLMVWRDLPGDGRYLIELDSAPMAVGISSRRLAMKVDSLVDSLLRRMESHWE